jgi:hypothetical protein
VPIGERPPPVPTTDTGQDVQFRVLDRWLGVSMKAPDEIGASLSGVSNHFQFSRSIHCG